MSAGRTRLCVETAADLQIGDLLHLHDRSVIVTHLNPATREKTIAAGVREVGSLSWMDVYDADEPVDATPRGPRGDEPVDYAPRPRLAERAVAA